MTTDELQALYILKARSLTDNTLKLLHTEARRSSTSSLSPGYVPRLVEFIAPFGARGYYPLKLARAVIHLEYERRNVARMEAVWAPVLVS